MIINEYAIFDRVAAYYSTPFFMATDGEALRAVADLARDMSTSIARHPADYALYVVGSFDTVSGKVEACIPTHLANVISLLRPQPPLPGLETPADKETV